MAIKMEGVTVSEDSWDFEKARDFPTSDLKAEVSSIFDQQLLAVSNEPESDEVIHNVDILTRLRKSTRKNTADWVLQHSFCPELYREKAKTAEGYSNAINILMWAFTKITAGDKLRSKRKYQTKKHQMEQMAFGWKRFEFPSWKEPSDEAGKKNRERNEQIKKMRQAENDRKKELRQQYLAKEAKLKALKAEKELAPSNEFLKICEISKKRRKAADLALKQAERELKEVTKAHEYYSEKLPEAR